MVALLIVGAVLTAASITMALLVHFIEKFEIWVDKKIGDKTFFIIVSLIGLVGVCMIIFAGIVIAFGPSFGITNP